MGNGRISIWMIISVLAGISLIISLIAGIALDIELLGYLF